MLCLSGHLPQTQQLRASQFFLHIGTAISHIYTRGINIGRAEYSRFSLFYNIHTTIALIIQRFYRFLTLGSKCDFNGQSVFFQVKKKNF